MLMPEKMTSMFLIQVTLKVNVIFSVRLVPRGFIGVGEWIINSLKHYKPFQILGWLGS